MFFDSHLETPEAKDIISKAELFYVTGFFLTVSVDSILLLGKHAVENSKIFSMVDTISVLGTDGPSRSPTDALFSDEPPRVI